MKTGAKRAGTLLILASSLAGCGPDPVDGEPFESPSRGPFYMPSGGEGSSSPEADAEDEDQDDDEQGSGAKTTKTQSAVECCRICVQGKACGDSCIDPLLTCSVGAGCACDG